MFRAIALLTSLALGAVVAEVVFQIAGYKHGRVSLRAFTQYDTLLGWRIAPNASWRAVMPDYTTVMQYGPKGLRGRDIPYAKPPGVSRTLILGDSMVDGFSVQINDRVSEVLQARLGPGNEVVNLGVSAYSTDQELLMLESEGWKYHPDLVVLFFFFNDVWMNGERRIGPKTFKPVFKLDGAGNLVLSNVPVPRPIATLEDRFKLYAMIRDAVKSRRWLYTIATAGHTAPVPSLPMPAGAGGSADQFRVYQREDKPELRRVWTITQALLRKMNQETREHGARFLVFYVPAPVELSSTEWSKSDIPDTYAPDVVVRHVKQICSDEGIALLEPSSRFREALKTERLSYPHDIHWTRAGHRLAADLLAEYIQNNGGRGVQARIRDRETPLGR